MPVFTLDKDNVESAAFALAETPLQVSIKRGSKWTFNETSYLLVEEDPDNPGTYHDTSTVVSTLETKLIQVKPKNYKIKLYSFDDDDSVTFIVS